MNELHTNVLTLRTSCSCVKDKPQDPVKTAVSINADTRVLVINEGNYLAANANISIYDPTSGAVVEDYYSQQNNNAQLGDVCQSVTKYNNKYKIEVCKEYRYCDFMC